MIADKNPLVKRASIAVLSPKVFEKTHNPLSVEKIMNLTGVSSCSCLNPAEEVIISAVKASNSAKLFEAELGFFVAWSLKSLE